MQPLNTFIFPLQGPALIEASAGTGKTYTIVNLYLRLLLGHQCTPLTVDKILVVTFTNAATAELKDRVRQKLQQAYLDFYAGHSDDGFVRQLIDSLDDTKLACQRLSLAVKQMDEAAIFTIHGFCQRMLKEHAFESGMLYEQTLIMDESEWLQLAVADFWRREIVTLNDELLGMILDSWAEPEALLKDIRNLLYRRATPIAEMSLESVAKALDDYKALLAKVADWWQQQNVAGQLLQADLNGRAKLGKEDFLAQVSAALAERQLMPKFDKERWAALSAEKLEKARKKTSKPTDHLDFGQFDQLAQLQQDCVEGLQIGLLHQAIGAVRDNLQQNKQRLSLLSPDDLLSSLQQALAGNSGNVLAQSIRQAYPAALIDEFQDTDPQQFEIFRAVYAVQTSEEEIEATPAPSWIMIGDPKQAIYAFRGADIFTYIQAKSLVVDDRQFTLATNYRTREPLVNAVNTLFTQREMAFLVEDSIPFYPVSAAKNPEGLVVQGQAAASLALVHLPAGDKGVLGWEPAAMPMAMACAGEIARILQAASDGNASVAGKAPQASDCCVLVRDRLEADLIKQALAKLNVASVFLVRKSVFATQMAYDLYLLLQALAHPGDERKLKAALTSELFAFTAEQLDALFANELQWQRLTEQVFQWHRDWRRYGLMLVLEQVFAQYDIYAKLVAHFEDGMRRVTDLRHLTELLQQQSALVNGESQLLHWYESHLADPDHDHEGQQLRLETDANLVQIITQHASKGLEFPLVFLPFVSRFRTSKEAIFHDATQGLMVDLLASDEHLATADHERLAEDIRLFYVALTRAEHYCWMGVWNFASGRSKQSALLQSAIGTLLLHDVDPIDDGTIASRLQSLTDKADISYRAISDEELTGDYAPYVGQPTQQTPDWQTAILKQPVKRSWQLTSYSAIASHHQVKDELPPGFDEGVQPMMPPPEQEPVPSPFSFVRGANAGSFLHGVFENIDFTQPDNLAEVIEEKGKWYGIDASWYPMLHQWLGDVLLAKFATEGKDAALQLAALAPQQVKIEMEFHMPLTQVRASQFNQILNQYAPRRDYHYQFEQLNGMLKGFIDLLFEYQGRFYVADYKSNHLGDSLAEYHGQALETAMVEHDYHLQAILYSLALHRWLKPRIANYDYDTHCGGAYYLFLRGMHSEHPGNGIYHFTPQKGLILALDRLFDGEAPEVAQQHAAKDASKDNSAQGQLDLW